MTPASPVRQGNFPVALVGPTASGKGELALRLAEDIPAEIVCVDSMKIYRGMDVGTAKPKAEVRRRVPHHMLDLVEPDDPLTAARFGEMAREVIFEIASRGRLPLVTAGSGLYLRAILGWIFPGPEANWEVRERLRREAEAKGGVYLHERLRAIDPQAASGISPQDERRLIRALEVHELTGRPISELQSDHAGTPPPFAHPLLLGIRWRRSTLYSRIDARAEAMVKGGLIEEVNRLRARGFASDVLAMQALGYAQVGAYVDGGMTLQEALDTLQRQTRRFAKHQMTWFRGMGEVEWFDVPPQGLEALRGQLLRRIGAYLASRGATV